MSSMYSLPMIMLPDLNWLCWCKQQLQKSPISSSECLASLGFQPSLRVCQSVLASFPRICLSCFWEPLLFWFCFETLSCLKVPCRCPHLPDRRLYCQFRPAHLRVFLSQRAADCYTIC